MSKPTHNTPHEIQNQHMTHHMKSKTNTRHTMLGRSFFDCSLPKAAVFAAVGLFCFTICYFIFCQCTCCPIACPNIMPIYSFTSKARCTCVLCCECPLSLSLSVYVSMCVLLCVCVFDQNQNQLECTYFGTQTNAPQVLFCI